MLNITCIIPSPCSEKSYPVLERCITCIREAEAKVINVNIKILLITNGDKIILKTLRKKINHLIKYRSKYSFAKMNNRAIEYAIAYDNPDWILLINDDAFIKPNFFLSFVKLIRSNKSEIISPLVYENGTTIVDSYGVEYFNSGYAKNNPKISTKTQLAAAACLLVKKSLLINMMTKYGFYFNEILTSYMEDVDFTLRARALNTNIIKSKKMVVNHMVSYTNSRRSYYVMYQTYRNIIWIIIMNWPIQDILRNIHNIILVQLWVFVFSLFTKGPFMYLKIWVDTIKNIRILIKMRHSIIPSYENTFRFKKVLSKYAFRTYHGYKIRLP